ncbi:MAG: arsenite S-adenosylmethyltransferase [Bdellovibrionales bacterium RIFOXYB1_FULL_37_110]|nr:MAG: arsenite S-adenosylmethyltransferase [Bdellovibrionales bacterium RIFOXYC1_FULL_37_79]OFZ57353.1 MAG: arsenite S-adenosylmethyltransferase [Bdellovibrionales bacterium RIFOXYB1_FULL_37_110]OFZ62248.1 MAG: arsenite S-adenosylmethyltransferase [Bdellovibrionales bacterium RIFOXYD1_FULL_36_51]
MKRLHYLFDNHEDGQSKKLKSEVKKVYSQIATSSKSCGCSPSCCQKPSIDSKKTSLELGYAKEDIESIPEGANMGLGCGNPQIFASLKKGETVLDLGSGGGFDCFIAAKEVGKKGKVIGIDMTPEMISLANKNAQKGKYSNVEFHLGEIEQLPIADSTIDVIISNCVINLSTDKQSVFQEAFRVLNKGGRLAISDVIKTCPLPKEVDQMIEAYTGCIAGASTLEEIKIFLTHAGFKKIKITPKDESREFIKNWLPGSNIEDYVQSVMIEAVKP